MILDSSAVVSIILRERGFDDLLLRFSGWGEAGIGAPTLTETAIVLSSRLGPRAQILLGSFLQEFEVAILPFGVFHWRQAFEAYERFGKGRHRASLNFGDCLSYATAKLAGRPLLCLGNDFSETDLDLA